MFPCHVYVSEQLVITPLGHDSTVFGRDTSRDVYILLTYQQGFFCWLYLTTSRRRRTQLITCDLFVVPLFNGRNIRIRIVSRPVSCVVVSYISKSNLLNNIKLKSEVCECACQYFRKPFSPFRQHYYSFCLNDPSDPFFPIRSISPHPTPFPLPRSLPLHPRCFPIPPRALRRVVGILGNYPSLPPSSADPFCLSPFHIIHPLLPSSPL